MKVVKYLLRPFAKIMQKITYHLMKDVMCEQKMLSERLVKKIECIEQTQEQCESHILELKKQLLSLNNDYEELQKKFDLSIERWTWERYQRINQNSVELTKKVDKLVERWTWERYQRVEKKVKEMHRHIDFTYRDIMVAMERQMPWLPQSCIKLKTDFPVAYESLDHIHPHGTVRDNTRYPRFIAKCEQLLSKKQFAYLDLGCSGGGMVLDAALRGHKAFGLEGSDSSLKSLRAEWRLLGDRLQTCDITKPFRLEKDGGQQQLFDVITAWEVLEHIAEQDLPQLISNIKNHLNEGGIFVASIANWDDIDPVSGTNWHVTVHPYSWWQSKFESAGFLVCTELIEPIDLARGAYNPPLCYAEPSTDFDPQKSFHIVAKR